MIYKRKTNKTPTSKIFCNEWGNAEVWVKIINNGKSYEKIAIMTMTKILKIHIILMECKSKFVLSKILCSVISFFIL